MNKPRLMLHTGANTVTMDQVREVFTPASTHTWTPIPHGQLIDTVQGALKSIGMEVGETSHALARDGNRYFGLMEIMQPEKSHDEYAFVLALRNSHDKCFPAGLAAGSSVFCCDNLAFSGEVTMARRHTYFINRDLPKLVGEAVGRLSEMWKGQEERYEAYRNEELWDAEVHDLVIRASDLGAITNQMIPKVLAEWRKPSHEEFAPRNAWSFFNAVTESLKGGNVMELPKRTVSLHGILDAKCGIGKN